MIALDRAVSMGRRSQSFTGTSAADFTHPNTLLGKTNLSSGWRVRASSSVSPCVERRSHDAGRPLGVGQATLPAEGDIVVGRTGAMALVAAFVAAAGVVENGGMGQGILHVFVACPVRDAKRQEQHPGAVGPAVNPAVGARPLASVRPRAPALATT